MNKQQNTVESNVETFSFLTSYEDKMNFLASIHQEIRHKTGIVDEVVDHDDSAPTGKYLNMVYSMGTI